MIIAIQGLHNSVFTSSCNCRTCENQTTYLSTSMDHSIIIDPPVETLAIEAPSQGNHSTPVGIHLVYTMQGVEIGDRSQVMHHFGITVQAFSLPKMSLLTAAKINFSPVPFISPEASLLFFSTHFTDKSKGAICTTQSKGIVRTCVAISYNLVASESNWNIWLVDFGGTDKACRDAHIS